jgi:hypothetical protein
LDQATKFSLALIVIGVILLAMPSPNGSNAFTTFFGSPWISGLTGNIPGISESGTSTMQQATLLTSGTVNFKMSLVSRYADNTNETIFEKSTLPGLAVISIHGKAVRDIIAYALVAVKTAQELPSSALARFELNFTSCIEQLNRCKWNYQVTTTPLVGNGTLALVALPPFAVLPTDVYPAALAAGTVSSRRVDWAVSAHVTVTAPGYQNLDLLGSTLSYADFAYDGSITGGCTDCAASGSIIGGGVSHNTGEGNQITGLPADYWYLQNPVDYCAANPTDAKCKGPSATGQLVTATYTNAVEYITGSTTVTAKVVETTTGKTSVSAGTTLTGGTLAPPPITSHITVEVDAEGRSHTYYTTENQITGQSTTQTANPTTTTTTSNGAYTYTPYASSTGSAAGSGTKPGQNGVIMSLLPLAPLPLTWTRLDVGGTVYLVNPATWILAALAFFAFLPLAWPYLEGKRKLG